MRKFYYYLSVLSFISTMIFNPLAQEKLRGIEQYLNNNETVMDSVAENYADNNMLSAVSFFGDINLKTSGFFDKLVLKTDADFKFEKVRGINNVSEMYKENSKSIVLLVQPDYSSMGAGCLVSEDGYIVTNYHVVQNTDKMLTFFYDNNITKIEDINIENFKIANVIAAVPDKDLALLKIDSVHQNTSMKFGDNFEIEIGQDVFAIGHPESFIWSFTTGVISQLRSNYEWTYDNRNYCRANVIQTQTPINPGNSGGPLFNVKGELIGINSFRTPGAEGLNFAIRIDEIETFLQESRQGMHQYKLVAEKNTAENTIIWVSLDTDGNGIIDAEAADLNGNGDYDIMKVDENEDGFIDYIVVDSNQDGFIDMYIYDRNRDGHFEYYIMDLNYDRYLDTIGIDTNKDGLPNEFYDYRG
jgi:S1-C subfamily serine protease